MRSNRLPEKIAKRLAAAADCGADALSVRTRSRYRSMQGWRDRIISARECSNGRRRRGMADADRNRARARGRPKPGAAPAPFCPNLIIKRAQMRDELQALVKHRVEMVITSVGSPAEAIKPLHDVGCIVFADVATLHHTERAIAAGVDGLILLTAGAGGQTGWLNPIAFVRSARAMFDGPIVLAGGISDGHALWAAEVLGCDLAYMGTKFIATHESMAPPAYKKMLVESGMDDVMLTQAFTGLDTNMLRPSMIAAGLDPSTLPPRVSNEEAAKKFSSMAVVEGPRRYKDIWSAGHSISGVDRIQSAAELVDRTLAEYFAARDHTARRLS